MLEREVNNALIRRLCLVGCLGYHQVNLLAVVCGDDVGQQTAVKSIVAVGRRGDGIEVHSLIIGPVDYIGGDVIVPLATTLVGDKDTSVTCAAKVVVAAVGEGSPDLNPTCSL